MAIWQKENNHDKTIKIILFVFFPFLSFFYSLKRLNTKSSFVVFYLFAILFGMAFTVPISPTAEIGIDGIFY
jgi:hypothetical protein